jgi:hypothetical protein
MTNEKSLNPDSNARANQVYREFKAGLLKIADELALRDRTDHIQAAHIDEARMLLAPNKRNQKWRELAKYVGGACAGIFLPGLFQVLRESATKPLDIVSPLFYIIILALCVGLTV